jgi:hypothetical protein
LFDREIIPVVRRGFSGMASGRPVRFGPGGSRGPTFLFGPLTVELRQAGEDFAAEVADLGYSGTHPAIASLGFEGCR